MDRWMDSETKSDFIGCSPTKVERGIDNYLIITFFDSK